jgi:alkyl hydroperoxide reductase subunit D
MSIDNLKSQLPDYAKDIKLNLSSLLNEDTLGEQALWGTLVACAYGTKSGHVIAEIESEAREHLSEEALNAAKAAAAIMAMNNVYYKFVGMVKDPEYGQMPGNLRMNVISNPGVDKHDFELWALAVSAINGCQPCVNAHVGTLSKEGIDSKVIQTAVRIAAVVQATAAVLSGEAATVSNSLSAAA